MTSRQMRNLSAVCFSILISSGAIGWAAEIRVLPETIDGVPVGELLQRNLLLQADHHFNQWRERYEQVKTVEQARAYQIRQREFFLNQLGDFPERTPLKPQVAGTVTRPGVKIEKIIFESRPKHFVTGAMFLPDEKTFPKPWPGVLVVCGHSANGKGYPGYQSVSMLLALNGMAAFLVDPICQGERLQFLDTDGKPIAKGSTTGHTLIGLGSILLGRNTASFEIWDGMRAIDYLQSRADIDAKRIGCTGNSGGGTQSSYLMALDDRIQVAAPSCYLTSFERLLNTIGPQDAEQNISGQIAFGMDHTDYILMRAPKPTLICAATQDFFDITGTWDSFRSAKRFYTRFGVPENVSLAENDDTHGFKKPLREAAVQWLRRWLVGVDGPVREPELKVLTDREIQCTEKGQVQIIDGAVSVLDLNRRENRQLESIRKKTWQTLDAKQQRTLVQQVAVMKSVEKLEKQIDSVSRKEIEAPDRVSVPVGAEVKTVIIHRNQGVPLPGVVITSKQQPKTLELVFHIDGIDTTLRSSTVKELLKQNRSVAVFDVSGIGETSPTKGTWYRKDFGHDAKPVTVAYLLGKSFVGIRADDMATIGITMQKQGFNNINVHAESFLGIPAIHAAFVHPELFGHLITTNTLESFSSLLDAPTNADQWKNIIHGVLRKYDLSMLIEALGEKVGVKSPLTLNQD